MQRVDSVSNIFGAFKWPQFEIGHFQKRTRKLYFPFIFMIQSLKK